MKNSSVSYVFTQRDRQTNPPTATAATTARDCSARYWDTQIPEGTMGPGSEEGFSPFFLPHQPMLLLWEGLTWADPLPWLSPVTFYRACSHVWWGLGKWHEGSHDPPKRHELMLSSKQPHNPTNLLHCQEKGIYNIFWWRVWLGRSSKSFPLSDLIQGNSTNLTSLVHNT